MAGGEYACFKKQKISCRRQLCAQVHSPWETQENAIKVAASLFGILILRSLRASIKFSLTWKVPAKG